MKKITFIITTYKRIAGLQCLLKSIRENSVNEYDLLVIIDCDDMDTYSYCKNNNIKCLLSSHKRECVKQTNLGIYACVTPYFVWLSDDFEIKTKDFINRILASFKHNFQNDIGVLVFNDGMLHGEIATVGMSSKKFVRFMGGHFQYPEYEHYCADRELVYTAKSLGCYAYDETIKVIHHHHSVTGTKDAVYTDSENECLAHDRELILQRCDLDLTNIRNYIDFEKTHKTAIVTAITDFKDVLRDPIYIDKNADYFCFTDETEKFTSSVWNILPIDKNLDLNPQKKYKYYKIMTQEISILKYYDYTIWIDANLIPQESLMEFIPKLHGRALGIFKHYERDCIYDEIKSLIKLGRDDPRILQEQYDKYKNFDYPEHNGLFATSLIIRDHRNERLNEAQNIWWSEIKQHSSRCQASFNYALTKASIGNFEIAIYGIYMDEIYNKLVITASHNYEMQFGEKITLC